MCALRRDAASNQAHLTKTRGGCYPSMVWLLLLIFATNISATTIIIPSQAGPISAEESSTQSKQTEATTTAIARQQHEEKRETLEIGEASFVGNLKSVDSKKKFGKHEGGAADEERILAIGKRTEKGANLDIPTETVATPGGRSQRDLAQDSSQLQPDSNSDLSVSLGDDRQPDGSPIPTDDASQSQQVQVQPTSGGSSFSSVAKRKLLLKTVPSMLNSAVINGKVSLPCDISPASADDSVALILWYKDDSLAPIYTIDARKANSLEKAKTSLDEAYSSRASFSMKAKPAQLQLERVRQEDEGEYRCRVDFKRGRTVNTLIALRVVVPPEELRIVSPQKPHARLEGLIGPFNEGAELTLLCLATGGKPRPQISWRRDFNVIDETYQHVDKEGTSNELKIPSLSKNHLLSIFTCQASNNNLTSPMQTSITLDLNLKPQEISLKQLGQEPLVVGQTATFECLTQGSRPQATIHWLFQGTRHEAQMSVDQQQSSSRISLTLQRSYNQQALTCVAENSRIAQAAALRQTLKLDVHYPPQLSVRLESPGGQSDYSSSSLQQQQPEGSEQQHQEGNDIYLTCQVDANPRPIKPILWRFNGRALQQNSNMIVMNNQSLVLRKVSRQQAGLYSCDATNQHGSNSSKPAELVIRHAPVCQTDDILVFEASIGQTVKIDCNVIANPAKSVHYAWFSAPGEHNLTGWTQRDTSSDEQLDESSSRLKFRIKDERSFALIKCKAKNEIGLQQRACLFQVVQAPIPALRHTCSLLNSAANSLQVNCSPNEHLKSEEFELVRQQQQQAGAPTTALDDRTAGSGQSSSSSMSSWLNLDAIRHKQRVGNGADSTQNERLQLRLVYPPSWLLAEIYKATGGGGGSSRIASGESSQATATNVAADSAGQQHYELIAYVIVVGVGQQLANIKSIVEENRLFSSNPKSVYYVIARQQKQNNQTGANSSERSATQADDSQSAASMRATPAQPTLQFPYQNLHQLSQNQQQQQARLIEDPSIQLASSFAFTVPSLEPESKYKLLVFGQNLANKTRDWLVVKGETLAEDAESYSAGSSTTAQSFRQFSLGSQQDPSSSPSSSLSLSQQKSIVMRSDSTGDSATDGANIHQEEQLAFEQSSGIGRHHLASNSDNTSGRPFFANKTIQQQFVAYKDYAITYAKQKPLLAIPIAVTSLIAFMLLLVWTTSLLASLLRRRANSNGSSSSASSSSNSSSSTSSSSSMGSSSKFSATGGAKSNNLKGAGANLASGKQPLPPDCDQRKADRQQQQFGADDDQLPNGMDTESSSAAGLLMMMSSKGCAIGGGHNHHHHHQQQQFASSPDASSFDSRQDANKLMMMANSSPTHDCRHLEQQVYSIEPNQTCSIGNATDFSQEAANTSTTAAALAAKLYPSFVGHSNGHFMVGSLDRRELLHQPIYLTEPSGRTAFLQASQENSHSHSHQHQHAHQHFSSIDRRLGAAGFPVFKQQQSPMLLAAAELVQLERAGVYLQESPPLDLGVGRSIDGAEVSRDEQLMLGELAATTNCFGGSFSSTECSSVQEQPHSLASRSRREQRVAFDLSNQPACKQHQMQQASSSSSMLEHHKQPNNSSQQQMIRAAPHEFATDASSALYVDSSQIRSQRQQKRRQHQEQQQQQQQHALVGQVKPLQLVATTKGSDSGGSNSGNTADSGHESPPTGETNSTSYDAHQLVNHNKQVANCSHENRRQQQPQTGNLVMLMELSPGSQESSTILQSAGSYGELSQQSQSQFQGANNNVNFLCQTLHNNHQMATSFSTAFQPAANNSNLCSEHDQQSQSQRTNKTSHLQNWL